MFVPGQYRLHDDEWFIDLMRRNPLAVLASQGGPGCPPNATHLPVIADPGMSSWPDGLVGGTLIAHMNRANPHWKALEPGTPALVIFSGPNGYVSPTVYGFTPAAPTWNFTSVHVHGTLEKFDSAEESLDVVRSTVRALEGEFGNGWDMTGSVDYFRRILPAVGALRVHVTRVEGMFKLSQEQRPEIQDQVRRSFAEKECGRYRETAEMMGCLAPARQAQG